MKEPNKVPKKDLAYIIDKEWNLFIVWLFYFIFIL